ncbi:hypothetical protein ACQJBY_020892 [Aegilops geniculata]
MSIESLWASFPLFIRFTDAHLMPLCLAAQCHVFSELTVFQVGTTDVLEPDLNFSSLPCLPHHRPSPSSNVVVES